MDQTTHRHMHSITKAMGPPTQHIITPIITLPHIMGRPPMSTQGHLHTPMEPPHLLAVITPADQYTQVNIMLVWIESRVCIINRYGGRLGEYED